VKGIGRTYFRVQSIKKPRLLKGQNGKALLLRATLRVLAPKGPRSSTLE